MTFELRVGIAHCLLEVTVEMDRNEVGDHLSVGLGTEACSVSDQPLTQFHVVLDDPVDDDVDLVSSVEMWMGVLLVYAAMSGPACVADTDRRLLDKGCRRTARRLPRLDGVLELGEIADRAHSLDRAVRHHRDAGRVVAAVLELREPCEQQLFSGTRADITYDSTHG